MDKPKNLVDAEVHVTRKHIFKEIEVERMRQNRIWGSDFDGKNTTNDWVTYMMIYLGQAAAMNRETRKFEPERVRKQLIKAVTIGIAALEQLSGAGVALRHYDVL